MKAIDNLKKYISVVIVILFLIPQNGFSQKKRLKPPKRVSKIESVDQFVSHSFELYHKVFVYDSLTKAGVEVPAEIENQLLERAEQDIDSLWQVLPTILDDMTSGDANIMIKGKATINLNKSKRALKYCMKTMKVYFIGTNEDEDDD
ncbi:hypothetical protein [Ichthyenterobacterium magnum]|uniref:Uncharacterized protein n=1 Tax=Ichthyenterobacterium magnum TaxID=1230530 RepID=A0A420DL17_9FLAO|nr:hypothetical protein [Ichthyenterobacterium magnum]RKE94950.1 hypothetical protein BXY80_1967 [Ichthyenterobacterium magnum]